MTRRFVKQAVCMSVLTMCFAGSPRSLVGQDQIVLQIEGQSSRTTMPCQIVDYTGERISVQLKSGPKSYPSEQVVEVRTDWLESHERGRKLLAERKAVEASKQLQIALADEKRPWVRREILSLLIRSAMRQGDRSAAAARFLELFASDRTTRHFGLIPLTWAAEPPSQAAKFEAKSWLAEKSDVARLLGASWLLDDTSLAESAQRELQQLASSTDDRIRPLAQAQVWRTKLRSLEVSDVELKRWDDRIREMPASLRAGPTYLLGRGWVMRREHDRAATALLWPMLMNSSDTRLAARAALEAADSLRRLGQKEAALRIQQEVAAQFPDNEFGEAAGAK